MTNSTRLLVYSVSRMHRYEYDIGYNMGFDTEIQHLKKKKKNLKVRYVSTLVN